MAAIIPDLTKPVQFAGVELNVVTIDKTSGVPILYGCTVDNMDVSDVDVVQFTEKLALKDGLDIGGVWMGARRPSMKGTVWGRDRAEAQSILDTMEVVMLPATGTFGLSALTFWTGTQRSIQARPNGLRVGAVRDRQGGDDNDPIAIEWTCTFLCPIPTIV